METRLTWHRIKQVFNNESNPVTRLLWEQAEGVCVAYCGEIVRKGSISRYRYAKFWAWSKIEKRLRDFLFKG